jgi:DNA-binding PucR family transcriptional regulator
MTAREVPGFVRFCAARLTFPIILAIWRRMGLCGQEQPQSWMDSVPPGKHEKSNLGSLRFAFGMTPVEGLTKAIFRADAIRLRSGQAAVSAAQIARLGL